MSDLAQLASRLRSCPESKCQALPGDPHHLDCALAICQATGDSRILHIDADTDQLMRQIAGIPEHGVNGHDCGNDIWTGELAGTADCRRYGWYVRLGRGADRSMGWIPCPADDPDAQLDFYRLYTDAVWSPSELRWIAPGEPCA